MPFFVATYQEAWPDRAQELLAAIRGSFADRTLAPARRNARVFQRLNEQTRFLTVSEWESQAAYESLRQSAEFVETSALCGPRPTAEYFERLHLFLRMNQRAAVVVCATIDAAADRVAEAEAFLRGASQREMVTVSGLVSRELYQSIDTSARFLVVLSWRSIAELEQFRATDAPRVESALQRLGCTLERFTGEIAAEYAPQDRTPASGTT